MRFTIIKIKEVVYDSIPSNLPNSAKSLNGKTFQVKKTRISPIMERTYLLFGILPIFKYSRTKETRDVIYEYQIE